MARARQKQQNDPLTNEIVGIGVATLGAVLFVGLCIPNSGWFGETIGKGLRAFVGLGAFVMPLVLIFVGYTLAVGTGIVTSRNKMLGAVLVFAVFVTWAQLAVTPNVMSVWPTHETQPDRFAADLIGGGGYLGLAFSLILSSVFGAARHVVLAGVLVISVMLTTGSSFIGSMRATQARLVIALQPKSPKVKQVKATGNGKRNGEKTVVGIEKIAEAAPKGKAGLLAKLKAEIFHKEPDAPVPAEAIAKSNGKPPVVVHTGAVPKSTAPAERPPVPHGDSEYKLPPVTLLKEPAAAPKRAQAELNYKIQKIEQTLEEFKIEADVVEVSNGPTVTRYEIQLAPGIKVNKIVSLADNLAMALAAIDVRVEAPIPGKAAIGVEVPNDNPAIVSLREIVDTDQFWNAPSKITFPLGKDVAGVPRYADLAKMPHLLVAGATNAGKSVCLNALIAGLLFRATPRELKFVLIDPKRVELSLFDGIPHLCSPVIKDVRQAAGILRAVLKEMERRYDMLVQMGTRNLDGYNQKVKQEERIPYIVVIIDELADLMMQAGPEVEFAICRIAQLARATGIHLVVATQRPSVDVVTGLIKANISSRISFAVSSQIDSRTILDTGGAERLIGRGDMLFKPIDASKPSRIQGCFVTEKEIEDLVKHLKEQESPDYTMQPMQVGEGPGGDDEEADDASTDEVYEPAVRMVVTSGYASTSMIQRKFKIGYTRAARLVDTMEQHGIVGPLDGAKPREVLVQKEDLDRIFGRPIYGNGDSVIPLPPEEEEE